jgi:exodeoxyribonuclease VII large subunit
MKTASKNIMALFGTTNSKDDPPNTQNDLLKKEDLGDAVCDVTSIVDQMEGALRRVGQVHVIGELSSFRPWRSGNWFFDLKDEKHAVPCMMPRRYASQVDFTPEDGMQIIVSADVAMYRAQAKAQLMVRRVKKAGRGMLLEALERLRAKLLSEGLFDETAKKDLPSFPRVIGLVTSPQSAALQDMIKVLRARSPRVSIILSPTRVQGEGASHEITAAIRRLDESRLVDLMIVGRGGGSLEDLMSFQMESVVRAIANCQTPVISAVGHESDHSLTDDVADLRAATPSHAAELAVPRLEEILAQLHTMQRRMVNPIWRKLSGAQTALANCERRLGEPRSQLYAAREELRDQHGILVRRTLRQQSNRADKLKDLSARLSPHAPSGKLNRWRKRCHAYENSLARCDPRIGLAAARLRLEQYEQRLRSLLEKTREEAQYELEKGALNLHTLSPLAVLNRGYTLARRPDGQVVTDAKDLSHGDPLQVIFRSGHVLTEVKEVEPARDMQETPVSTHAPRAKRNAGKNIGKKND